MTKIVEKILSFSLWPSLLAFPFVLSNIWCDLAVGEHTKAPAQPLATPSPVGLLLGLTSVVVGQIFVILYFCACEHGFFGNLELIQSRPSVLIRKSTWSRIMAHICQPEGFVLLGTLRKRAFENYFSNF